MNHVRLLSFLCITLLFSTLWGREELRFVNQVPWGINHSDSNGIHLEAQYAFWGDAFDASEQAVVHGYPGLRAEIWMPLTSEFRLWASFGNQAQLDWSKSLKNQEISRVQGQDTLMGAFDLSHSWEGSWSILRLGGEVYRQNGLHLGIAIERHALQMASSGAVQGDLQVHRTTIRNTDTLQEIRNYAAEQFQSHWDAQYAGSTWGIRLRAKWKYMSYEGSLGKDFELHGHYNAAESMPSFLSFYNLNVDSQAIAQDSVRSHEFANDSNYTVSLPHTHSIRLQYKALWASYTWISAPFRMVHQGEIQEALDLRNKADLVAQPEHMSLLGVDWNWLQASGGCFWWNGKLKLIAHAGTSITYGPWQAQVGLDVLPIVLGHLGVDYAF